MNLSTDLLLQFAKMTKDDTNKKTETTVYGTIVEYSGSKYVKIDGSDQLTPADSTVITKAGDRVTVLLKNHTATITGNISSPAASDESVENVVGDIAEFNQVLSNYATIEQLKTEKGRIDTLVANNVTINETLATNKADIKELQAEKLSAEDIEGKYANIDFSNISHATMGWFYSHSGLIQNVTVSDGTITGELIGVTLKGDLIEGNTIKAEKLVVKGSDGLYYKLNTDGIKVEAEQTDYNSLNGSIITAKSITASKISVDDLVAFDATIGGFNITDSSIYSGVKSTVGNTTSGIYLGKDGQVSFGDSQNFIKYYKDQNGNYKLDISAESITFGLNSQNLATTITDIQTTSNAAVVSTTEEFYNSTSPTSLTGGTWSTSQPVWTEGKYVWRRTKIAYGDGSTNYTPSNTGVCITGNTGAQGMQGEKGDKGDTGAQGIQGEQGVQGPKGDTGSQGIQGEKGDTGATGPQGPKGDTGATGEPGVGVSNVDVKYYKSTSATSLSGGSWSTTNPGWENGKYIWSKTVITYTDGTSEESNPVCITGAKGSTGSTGAKGETGSDGKGITSIVEQYYQSTSSTSLSGGSWSSTYPGWVDGEYIWTRSVITYTDGSTTTTTAICVTGAKGSTGATGSQGPKGDTGATGKGIKSISEKYAVSSSNSTAPTTWYDTVQTMTTTNKYLWNYEIVTYTDDTTSTTAKRVIGVYGNTGSTGATGKGISSITNYYLVTSASSGVTTSTSGWSTTPSATTTTNKYLWNYEKITYTDNTTASTTPHIIGTHGATGDTGATGPKGDTGATGAKGSPGVDYSRGKMIHVDPMFISGTNNCDIYNNKSNGTVTITRSSKSSDNPMTGTNYELVIKNTGEASPGLGGYVQSISSRANAIFIRRIIAKIPVGYSINNAENSLGTGYSVEWLTSKAGTGKFTEYIYKYTCGATGTFSSGGHVYIDGTVGTTSEPVTWYVAYSTTFDMTNISDVSESAKTATNFMSFDSTNGLLVGNKTSGSWSGTRAQIKSNVFNILDSSGTAMASYGATTTIGKTSANNVYIDSDSIDIRKGTSVLATFDQYGLKIANSNDASGSLGSGTSKPALVIGSESGYHIEMDNNEIMAKSNATTTSHLFLNMEGGNVSVNNNCDRAMMFQEGALYAKNKNYNSGNWLGIIDGINENGNTTFGYGGYLQEIGTTNIYGNDIYLYSKGNINANTSFVVKNGYSFQGTNTSGELRNNLQPCNTNDNCVIGYGSYNAGEGATNIYGKTISLTYDNLKLNGVDYDSGWKTPSISSSLSVYGSDSYNAIKYRKVGKVVDICGAVSPASTSTLANGDAVTVFTLPQAYRPSYTRTYVCHGSGRDVFMVQVQSAGGVTISRYRSTTSTSNAYPTSVATTNWLPISVTFTVD